MSFLPTLFERRGITALDDLLDIFADQSNGGIANVRVDLQETPAEYVLKADLPGFNKEEVNVTLTNQVLTISAEQKQDKEEKNTDYVIRERRYKSVQRSIPLSSAGSPDNVKAELKDGVLEVHIKKSPEKQAKRIPVQ